MKPYQLPPKHCIHRNLRPCLNHHHRDACKVNWILMRTDQETSMIGPTTMTERWHTCSLEQCWRTTAWLCCCSGLQSDTVCAELDSSFLTRRIMLQQVCEHSYFRVANSLSGAVQSGSTRAQPILCFAESLMQSQVMPCLEADSQWQGSTAKAAALRPQGANFLA